MEEVLTVFTSAARTGAGRPGGGGYYLPEDAHVRFLTPIVYKVESNA